jgi:hypothetical protein
MLDNTFYCAVSKDVGMSSNQFLHQGMDDPVEGKQALFPPHLGVENNLKKHIPRVGSLRALLPGPARNTLPG